MSPKPLKFSFLLFLVLLLNGTEHPWTYSISDDDGLPSNEVYQILQDDFGYLWIGCDAGLFRYDGFEYKNYTTKKQSGRSISGLMFDKENRIWCKNFTGQIFCVQGDSLKAICDLTGLSNSNLPFCVDDEGVLFVGLSDRVNIYNLFGDTIRALLLDGVSAGLNGPIRSMAVNGDYIYCHVGEKGTYCGKKYEREDLQLIDSTPGIVGHSIAVDFYSQNQKLYGLYTDHHKSEYRFTEISPNGVTDINIEKKPSVSYRIHCAIADADSSLWLCTSSGLLLTSTAHPKVDSASALFPKEKISWVMKDKEGSHWFATLTSGMICAPSLDVHHLSSDNSALREKQFTFVQTLKDGSVLAGSYTGHLYRLDEGLAPVYESNTSRLSIAVKSMAETEDAIITARGATSVCSKDGKHEYPVPISNARDVAVMDDSMFLILPEVLCAFSLADIGGKTDPAQTTIIRKTGGRSTEWNPSDSLLYCAFNDGVFSYRKGSMQRIEHNTQTILVNALSCSGTEIWCAGISSGLLGIVNGKVVHEYNTANGLFENEIRCVFAKGDTVIAASSERLYIIDVSQNSIVWYNITSGINAKDINSITMSSGKVWLATGKGMISFPADLRPANPVPPSIRIESVVLNDVALSDSNFYELPGTSFNLRINCSSVALRARGKYELRYRMSGIDSVWNAIPAINRSITYSGLAPGDYTFEVIAVNEYGVESVSPSRIRFHVPTPVWQSWWFYLLAMIVVISVVMLIAQQRLKSVRKKAEMKNKLIRSQLTALKAQMNPHFMYNALNSIQDLVIQHDLRNSSIYLSKFSKLMRAVLGASEQQLISVADEIEMLHLYLDLEKLRLGEQFTFEIILDDSRIEGMKIPSMLIQPYVENALKHGLLHQKGPKRLTIQFSVTEELHCLITDNGVGRARADEINRRQRPNHNSFATSATEKRIDLLNHSGEEIYHVVTTDLHEGSEATGTQVRLSFPITE